MVELLLYVLFEVIGNLFLAACSRAVVAYRLTERKTSVHPGISSIWLFLGLVASGLLLLVYLRPAGYFRH